MKHNQEGLYPRGFSSKTDWKYPLVQAGKLVTLNYGKALTAQHRVEGDVPVYGTNGQCGHHNEFLVSGPGVILGRKGQGPLGVEWSENNFWVIDTAYYVTAKSENIDLQYFYYLVRFIGLNHLKDGTSNPSLSRDTFSRLLLPLPPVQCQKGISKLLRNFDNKITLNRQINQTLEQMAQTLFKSWFVDFDPVIDNALDADNPIPDELQHRAEARKAVRESEGFKPLPDDVRQLFPDAFEESELGWVPKGWVVSTAGDEFTVKGGSTPSTKNAEFWEGGDIHWTSPKDLSGKAEKILLDTERKITATGLSKITSGLLPPETVLMSSRAPVGYLAMTKVPVAINQGYIAITECKSLTQEFALYWLDSKIEMIKSISGGTTFAEISKKTFRTIPIVVPSAQSANAFSETVALYLSKISKNVEECRSLSALRDSLLPKLISGELEII
ncbi:restriction endonuclease subunit S [Enterovibrio norvegicus]|uniref:Type I restriction enzyme, S subunit n=1 Tax=Enterovibrio norvegicus DSM 15893 TaxID=1121869 RepID=A0A1I5XQ95_9GAMM|nr:restriction endonuclease subunit S [Enterovibrio norvegicus]SFQ34123.1 type I restriction enzyme, S subunit [Enterovibrio norvegicus DSM 15893]